LEGKHVEDLNKKKYIFGSLFLLSNRLQTIGDQYLGEAGITTKQWLLNVMLAQLGDKSPTLSEVTEVIGSSRQNVKQLALKLEDKGFLTIEKDEEDARALRLKLTEKSKTFWRGRHEQDNEYIKNLFKELTPEEVDAICSGFNKLFKGIKKLEKSEKEGV
jgi:DNA-binding MarR family transcriptional regulator